MLGCGGDLGDGVDSEALRFGGDAASLSENLETASCLPRKNC